MARQVNASKEVKRLKEELDGMIKKKLEIEKELAKEKAKKADELKEKLEVATKEIEKLEGQLGDWDQKLERKLLRAVGSDEYERKKISSTCVYERGGDHAFDNAQPEQIDNKDRVSELGSGEYNAQSSSANTSAFLAASHLYWNKNRERWYDNGDGDCLNIEPFPLSHNATQIEKYIDNLFLMPI